MSGKWPLIVLKEAEYMSSPDESEANITVTGAIGLDQSYGYFYKYLSTLRVTEPRRRGGARDSQVDSQ